MVSAYRSQLMGEIGDIQRGFGDYTPMKFDFGLFNDEKVSDKILYFVAKLWRDATDRNHGYRNALHPAENSENSSDHRRRHLVMSRDVDGSYKVIDKDNYGRVEAVIRPGVDKLEFIGTDEYIKKIGGRGEFGYIVKMAEDLDVLRDHPYKRQME